MTDIEPPSSDGQQEHHGSIARLRGLFRLLWRSRDPREAIDAMIAAPSDEDDESPITPQERVLIGNVLKVHDRSAADVMVPRVDVIAFDIERPFDELVKLLIEHGHSRVPVYRETLDDVLGFVHVKDVLAPVADRRQVKLAPMLRKVLVVAPSLPVFDLLVQMRQTRTHIAMVVDEFGGIDGLVTIEDLIEEIVGDIDDEHDVDETPIQTLEEQRGTVLRHNGDHEEVDTLGGLVFTLAGRVPRRGEVISHPGGLEFEVLDADPRRIKRLRVRGLPAAIA